ncbi:dephospho-CoA kinase-like [Bidens hawaiensis]|uniref:dephospho-CoA kinase-like n=1 Tax=Bidens hawaiensis TaxID=980011 RepID=UPI00404A1A82
MGYKVISLDVPSLFEAEMGRWTNLFIVVWIQPETQLMARGRTSAREAQNRISKDQKHTMTDNNENSNKILDKVTKPLTWTEFWLCRHGAIVAFINQCMPVFLDALTACVW